MNRSLKIFSTCLVLGLAIGPAAFAKEKPKKGAKGNAAADNGQIMATYDLDKNGNLDVSESGKLASFYEQNPQDPVIKPFDTDSDGKLSDGEIMKILFPNGEPKQRLGAKGKGKGKAKGKEKPKKK